MRKLTHQEAIHMPLADIVKYQRDTHTAWKNLTDKLDPMLAEFAELRNDIDNAVKNAMDRLPDAPWKDKTATEAVWLLSLAVADRDTLAARVAELEAERDEAKTKAAQVVERCDQLDRQIQSELAALRQPIDPDAWKTPLELQSSIIKSYRMQLKTVNESPGALFMVWNEDKNNNCTICPADAARAAQWLASYVAAHGCPVGLWVADSVTCCPCCDETDKYDGEDCQTCGFSFSSRTVPTDECVAQIKTSRKSAPETRPVEVGWSVTAEQAAQEVGYFSAPSEAADAMDYLAAHAVLPVPAGVPSVPELRDKFYASGIIRITHCGKDNIDDGIAAIRDAVLDGVGQSKADDGLIVKGLLDALHEAGMILDKTEPYKYTLRRIPAPELRKTHEPTDAEVEALARVLHKEANQTGNFPKPNWETLHEIEKERLLTMARAAFAHIGKPNAEMQICINRKNRRIDALKACVKKWKAKAEKPIASADTLEKLADVWNDVFDAAFKAGVDARIPAVTAILRAAKARVDVTPGHYTVPGNFSTLTLNKADIDYLNSRIVYGVEVPVAEDRAALAEAIREEIYAAEFGGCPAPSVAHTSPTFECKECADRPKNVVNSFNFTFDYDTGSWKVINIAPENAS